MAAVWPGAAFWRNPMTPRSEKLLVVVGRAIDAVGSLVFLKMLSTYAAKDDVGSYLLAASCLALALVVSFSAFDQGLLRNVTQYREQSSLAARYTAMLAGYLGLALVLGGLGVAVLAATGVDGALRGALAPLGAWFAFEALKNLNATVASGLRSRALIAAASAADYGSRLVLLWLAWRWNAATPAAIVGLLATASLVATGVFVWGQRAWLARFAWPQLRDTLFDSVHFAWPMMIWGVFGWLQNMSNRWLLSRFADLTVVAEYGVLVAIASFPVTALLGLVVTYTVPILYERESRQPGSARAYVLRVVALLAPVCSLMVLLAAVWHRELVILLSGPAYAGQSQMLPLVMASACLNAVCSVLTYAVFAQRRVASLLVANTLPGALGLVVGYVAVGRHGFHGAVASLVLTQAVAAVLFVMAFRRARPGSHST